MKSTYGDTAACRRHEGQAQHVDGYQVAALEGEADGTSFGIWRQTPCKDLLGRQPGHAIGARRHTRSLVLPDRPNAIKSARQDQREQPTRPAFTATPSAQRPARAGWHGRWGPAALGDAISESLDGQHPFDRVRARIEVACPFMESTTARGASSSAWSAPRGRPPEIRLSRSSVMPISPS